MKYIVIMIVALMLGQSAKAQKEPVAPRKKANAEYSKTEAVHFFLSDSVPKGTIEAMLMIVNNALEAAGETTRVDKSNVEWIVNHTTYEFKDFGAYINSRSNNNVFEWFTDSDGWSGNVAVFRYGKCVIPLFKTQCLNLLDIKQKITRTIPGPGVITKIDTIKVPASNAGTTIVLYNQNFIENSGNSTNTNTNTNTVNTPTGVEYSAEEEVEYRPRRRQVRYEEPIRPRQGYFQVGLNFQGGRQQQHYPQPRQPIERTGGYGVSGSGGGTGGGLGGDPRTGGYGH